ncbi:Hypothetical predicted protein [Xyrichtys novacula]|uniref:Uncharacterized protein n=1 Tax=Xyrichtys novacula TaxID=13765 RepID=A0AAV1HEX5_XYRNO|nr:Hypothetical predicted protein [Xyrichtys novacula]
MNHRMNMMHFSSIVQTPPLNIQPPSSPLRPQVGSQGCEVRNGVEDLFLSLQQSEGERIELKRKRGSPFIHPFFFPSTPPRPNPEDGCMLTREREERGGPGLADQGSVAISLCSDQ